jgi:hypothetical protein
MTANDNNTFKEFSDIITSYQDSPRGGNIPYSNKNTFRCLQCQREIVSSRYSPYCSEGCMSKHDAGIPAEKEHNNNLMSQFSKVFE